MRFRSFSPRGRTRSLAAALLVAVVLAREASAERLLLEGTVVTPDRVLSPGWVEIDNGRITVVHETRPSAKHAQSVATGGIIFPGLVDLHNHVPWNIFPRWAPPRHFSSRYEWRRDPFYRAKIVAPFNALRETVFCDMNLYGELRALAGGTTSVVGTRNADCIKGLVRNLDHDSGFYGRLDSDGQHLWNSVNLPNERELKELVPTMAKARFEAYLVHAAEGVDEQSRGEFATLDRQGLLAARTAIVHGLALGPAEFRIMQERNVALVWSPRCQMELYGRTTDVAAALAAGVEVALGPDWALTGSATLLEELGYAWRWAQAQPEPRLTPAQLVAMATTTAAHIAGVDDEVGAIRAGLRADLLVIAGDATRPHEALVTASPAAVQLVMIEGEAVYGDAAWLERAGLATGFAPLPDVAGKAVKLPAGTTYAAVRDRLQRALEPHGVQLAPLVETR
ncbi:MAG TPA: amidohydrolase family protein [Opitutaceae bacterium]|nr:amidohydrolase family protein [Opitutaceae bacterium]